MSLVFTNQADVWLGRITVGVILLASLGLAGLYYYGPPEYTRIGYAPVQPVAFSHEQHAGRLGMSCLYCHTGVEDSAVARIPSTQACMNCHQTIKADSSQLARSVGRAAIRFPGCGFIRRRITSSSTTRSTSDAEWVA